MRVSRPRVVLGGFGLGFVATVAVSIPAHAATTLGGALPDSGVFDSCDAPINCMAVQEALPGWITSAPFSGVIVRWSVRGTGTFWVVPIRYTDDATIVVRPGTPGRGTAPNAPVSSFEVKPGVPIARGDHVGLTATPGSTLSFVDQVAGADVDTWRPQPEPMTAPVRAQQLNLDADSGYNVVIEPDADGDGFGDETQDGCPSSSATASACPAPAPTPAPSAVALKGVSITRRGSLRVRFTISQPARVTVSVSRRHRNRYRRVVKLSRQVRAGANRVRIRRKSGRLRKGRYRVVVRVVDAQRNVTASGSARFRLPRRAAKR